MSLAARTPAETTSLPSSVAVRAPLGDDAFGATYHAHKDYVWHTLRRLGVHDKDRADLMHDAFLVCWQRRSSFDNDRPLKPWLFGICYRLVRAHRRRWFRRREQSEVEVATMAPQDELLDRARAAVWVQKAMAQMNVDQRAVFILHDLDGENIAACARALETSVNTLYSRLRLARHKLHEVVQAARGSS